MVISTIHAVATNDVSLVKIRMSATVNPIVMDLYQESVTAMCPLVVVEVEASKAPKGRKDPKGFKVLV